MSIVYFFCVSWKRRRVGEKEGVGGGGNHCDERAGDSDHACYCVVTVPDTISHDAPRTTLESGMKSNNT